MYHLLAFCTLTSHVPLGLCPDWEDWNPEDNKDNAAEAMKLADEWLGVPQVISLPAFFQTVKLVWNVECMCACFSLYVSR